MALTLNHYSIRTTDMAATERFYVDVLGLTVGPRPPFPFPGLWLYRGPHTEVANALPALFRAEADSMPLVRFDFLVLRDAGGSGGLRYYLNEMQTGLAARLLCDQLANPIVIAQSWAEGAVGCLQRQRQAAQPEASGHQ